ncbi:MAG: protein kinase [Caulobacterales bacterium]
MGDDQTRPARRRAPGAAASAAPRSPDEVASPTADDTPADAAQAHAAQNAPRLEVGAMLNHIYEISGLIARGGMAEVYRGVNVLTEERVAIKVILPHLADDPTVEAMFLREARTLLRLSHPALVQYRLATREPELGVLYLVTEFVDGPGLDEAMDDLKPSIAETVALMRRLAEGLQVAHDLGAIHRDLSPDNILLPDVRLDQAKIIDFGIVKDIAASSSTILGESFAGKLNYVAPEQLGDFGRRVGPWTDVYSLGLVMFGVASGQDAQLGENLVEAVDRRRAGVDLSGVPKVLRQVLAGMLQPDPSARFQSMAEVLSALDALRLPAAPSRPAPDAGRSPQTPAAEATTLAGSAAVTEEAATTAAEVAPAAPPPAPAPAVEAAQQVEPPPQMPQASRAAEPNSEPPPLRASDMSGISPRAVTNWRRIVEWRRRVAAERLEHETAAAADVDAGSAGSGLAQEEAAHPDVEAPPDDYASRSTAVAEPEAGLDVAADHPWEGEHRTSVRALVMRAVGSRVIQVAVALLLVAAIVLVWLASRSPQPSGAPTAAATHQAAIPPPPVVAPVQQAAPPTPLAPPREVRAAPPPPRREEPTATVAATPAPAPVVTPPTPAASSAETQPTTQSNAANPGQAPAPHKRQTFGEGLRRLFGVKHPPATNATPPEPPPPGPPN